MLGAGRQRGFTLIEAMTAISILALLLAVAAPNVTEWLRNTQVRNVSEAMQNGLRKARMEALRRNQIVTFWLVSPANGGAPDSTCALSSTSAAWVVSVDNPASKCDTAPSPLTNPRILETYGGGSVAPNLSVSGLGSDGATAATSVSFNGMGQTTKTATQLARIDLAHSSTGARRLRVTISPTGGIRMCDRDAAAGDSRACT